MDAGSRTRAFIKANGNGRTIGISVILRPCRWGKLETAHLGQRTVEDNWQIEQSQCDAEEKPVVVTSKGISANQPMQHRTKARNQKATLFDELYKQLPLTDEQKHMALGLIEERISKLGDLNYFKLHENWKRKFSMKNCWSVSESETRAWSFVQTLSDCQTNPDETGNTEPHSSRFFQRRLYARFWLNPDYLKEIAATAEKAKSDLKLRVIWRNGGGIGTKLMTLVWQCSMPTLGFYSKRCWLPTKNIRRHCPLINMS